jgi:putative transposase
MVRIVRESDAGGVPATAKKHGISDQTLYIWRKRFGALNADDVKRFESVANDLALREPAHGARDRYGYGVASMRFI